MKAFITIVGLNSYYGTAPFHEGQKLTLVKEPENRHDKEAIRVELPGLGLVGYVANSTYCERRMHECRSSLRQNRRSRQRPRLLHSCQRAGVPRENASGIL